MRVSVIIPVYNAEEFLPMAIESALAQPETEEVLLIEDGSTDHSLDVCRQYAEAYTSVKLVRHPGGGNLGASATRNLGIRKATAEFVAFLDADDAYLPGRFTGTTKTLTGHPDADGVYETVGTQYHAMEMRAHHLARETETIGLSRAFSPKQLFRALALGRFGFIHLDGLVVRRSALSEDLMFDPEFIQCQDSDLVLRMASHLRLYAGDVDRVVALRGIHAHNRIFNVQQAMHFRRRYLQKCINQKFYGSTNLVANLYIVSRRVGASRIYQPFKRPRYIGLPVKIVFVLGYLIARPAILVRLLSQIVKNK